MIAASSEEGIAMPWKLFRRKSDPKVLVDPWIQDWLDTPKDRQRPVDPEELFLLIDRADRLVVKEMPLQDAEIFFESTQRLDFDELKEALTIVVPEEGFHAMCIGEPCIELFIGDTRVAEIVNLSGNHMRWWNHWHSDAMLANPEPWISWFEKRGMDGPRLEVEQSERQRVQRVEQLRRWMDTMPLCLVPIWEESLNEYGRPDPALLSRTLQRSIPDRKDRIRALLYWFGSGAGRWSGYPEYETAAEALLLAEPHDALVTVSRSPDLSSAQLEGAARLFGGWNYSKRYPDETDRLPATLKLRLWDQVKDTEDQDKLKRAKSAFC